ncbi:hypothetical protein AB0F81_04835 [Actinoplanes sp. NPDC024001]|uniref:hypothetical protein n=1 Tax=Actinoplanes sp. NPDC024001 TaxID=3154598 RepID=UPI00340EAC31
MHSPSPPAARPLSDLSTYELRHLVPHLAGAGRNADLHRLLAMPDGDRNALWRELDDRDDPQGFLNAVAVAVARREALDSIGTHLPEAVRYALYAGSVRSLSETIPAPLLVRAVTCRVLEPRQALAYARQILSPGRRAATLALLHRELPEPDRNEVVGEAVDAARAAIGGSSDRAMLVQVTTALPVDRLAEVVVAAREATGDKVAVAVTAAAAARRPDLLPDALRWARELTSPAVGALALTRLVPLLPMDDRVAVAQEALDRALRFPRRRGDGSVVMDGEDWSYFDALELLSEHLTPAQLDVAAAAAEEIALTDDRVRVLSALARRYPDGRRAALVAQALTSLGEMTNQQSRNRAAAPLAGLLPKRRARQVLLQGWWWAGSEWTADRLVASAPYAGGRLVAPYLAAVRRIRSPWHRARALAALLDVAPPADRPGLATRAWRNLRRHSPSSTNDTYTWRGCVEQIAPHLEAADVPEALATAERIGDADLRHRVVSALRRYAPDDPEVLGAVALIADEGTRAEQLAALAPGLGPDQISRALSLAEKMTPTWRVIPLAALASRVPAADRPAMLRHILQVLRKAWNTGQTTDPFLAIAAMLDGPILDETVEMLLDKRPPADVVPAVLALAPRLTMDHWRRILDSRHWAGIVRAVPEDLVADAVELALERLDDDVGALCALASRATPDQERRIRLAADRCRFPIDRAALLGAVAPHLPDDEATDVVRDVISFLHDERHRDDLPGERLREWGEGWADRPCPPEVQRLLLDAAFEIEAPGNRAAAIRGIAGCLSPAMLRECVDRARRGDHPCVVLAAVLPALAGEERKQVMNEILAADPGGAALTEVADRLSPEELASLVGLAGSGGPGKKTDAAGSLENLLASDLTRLPPAAASALLVAEFSADGTPARQSVTWEPLAGALVDAPPDLVRPVLLAWLSRTDRTRAQFLAELGSLHHLLASRARPVIRAVDEAGEWWP